MSINTKKQSVTISRLGSPEEITVLHIGQNAATTKKRAMIKKQDVSVKDRIKNLSVMSRTPMGEFIAPPHLQLSQLGKKVFFLEQ